MLREIGYELLKMSSQKKSYIPFAGYLLFLVLCYIAFCNSTDSLAASARLSSNPLSIPASESVELQKAI